MITWKKCYLEKVRDYDFTYTFYGVQSPKWHCVLRHISLTLGALHMILVDACCCTSPRGASLPLQVSPSYYLHSHLCRTHPERYGGYPTRRHHLRFAGSHRRHHHLTVRLEEAGSKSGERMPKPSNHKMRTSQRYTCTYTTLIESPVLDVAVVSRRSSSLCSSSGRAQLPLSTVHTYISGTHTCISPSGDRPLVCFSAGWIVSAGVGK